MIEQKRETLVIHEKSLEVLRSKIDEATRDRIVDRLEEDTYTDKDGSVTHRAIIVRSVKSHLTE